VLLLHENQEKIAIPKKHKSAPDKICSIPQTATHSVMKSDLSQNNIVFIILDLRQKFVIALLPDDGFYLSDFFFYEKVMRNMLFLIDDERTDAEQNQSKIFK
jgi:hypothetical protein